MMENLFIRSLYDLSHTAAATYLEQYTYPWEALAGIGEFILKLGETLSTEEYEKRGEDIWVAKSATIFPTAYIHGPAIIGPNTEVRQCAFIRGNALVGANCVVGNSTELKNVILFDCVQVPHYNYVGDSILGYKSHMGAGSITSNVKSDKTLVTVCVGNTRIETGRKKFRSEEIRRNAWRFCRGGLQLGTESWNSDRPPHQCLSAFYGARLCAGK